MCFLVRVRGRYAVLGLGLGVRGRYAVYVTWLDQQFPYQG